jgi:hypothetical protein
MSTPSTFTPLVAVVTAVTVVIGAMITFLAHRAATRHESRALTLFSYGFGAITLGLLLGATGGLLLDLDVEHALFAQGVLVAPGFVLLFRSLYSVPRRASA